MEPIKSSSIKEEEKKKVDSIESENEGILDESHKVYEWTEEMTKKAEQILSEDKFIHTENMYSM